MANKYYDEAQVQDIIADISNKCRMPVLGAGGGFAPIGTINSYMGTTAPIGWLACDGTVYNIADYPDLATHIASHFGSTNFFGGNGTTTFGVPDLRGEFLRGSGTNSHTNQGSGANVGVHQDGTETPVMGFGSANAYWTQKTDGNVEINIDKKITTQGGVLKHWNGTRVSNDAATYTSRPTNTSVLFIIKATVSGDANAHQYSTEEQIVGQDEDGNLIYEKTIILDSQITLTGADWIEIGAIPKSSLNINKFLDCVLYDSAGTRWYLQGLRSDQTVLSIIPIIKNIPVKKFIIQYTKTQ